MKSRRFICALAALSIVVIFTSASTDGETPQTAYIKKYASVAVSEMYRSGIPASITLAQGLLESGYGLSPLAKEGNNHFGIKCHDWTGKKMYYDDDKRGECFRVYKNPDASFKDHSDFLRYRDRYKSLFDNEITDYKSWAYGLKKAGYATDPSYPSKLIKLIETYNLSQYDTMKPEDFGKVSKGEESQKTEVADSGKKRRKRRADRKNNKAVTEQVAGNSADPDIQICPEESATEVLDVPSETVAVAVSESRNNSGNEAENPAGNATDNAAKSATDKKSTVRESIPESPLSLEEPKKVVDKKASEVITYSLTRQRYTVNGVEFVYSQEGESYSSIASDFHLFLSEILRFNDTEEDSVLQPGTMVYIQAKKNQATRGLEKYISDEGGENLRDLSQRFGIRLKSLCKMNLCSPSKITVAGDEIKLRPDSNKK